MSKNEKLIERFKQLPRNFTFEELEKLLAIFGYVRCNKVKLLVQEFCLNIKVKIIF